LFCHGSSHWFRWADSRPRRSRPQRL